MAKAKHKKVKVLGKTLNRGKHMTHGGGWKLIAPGEHTAFRANLKSTHRTKNNRVAFFHVYTRH